MNNSRFWQLVILLTLLAGVGQMTNTIYAPAMTMIAGHFSVLPTRVQALMALYLLPYGLSQLIYGPLSDRYGRRPIILLGLCIYMLGALLTIFSGSFLQLLLGSCLQGAGIGVGGVMLRTVMRDCYDGKQLLLANSYLSAAIVGLPIAAPVIGGLLAGYIGWRSIFVFLGIYGVFVIFCQHRYFFETNLRQHDHLDIKAPVLRYAYLLRQKQFMGYCICLFIAFGGVSVFEGCGGILFTKLLSYSPQTASLLFIVPLPGYLLGSFLAGQLGRWISIRTIILYGIVLMAFGVMLLMIFALFNVVNAWSILVPISLNFAGVGLLFPAATSGAVNPYPMLAGTAGALIGALQNVGAGAATLLSAGFRQNSIWPLTLILTGLTILVALAYYYLIWPSPQHEVEEAIS